MLIHGDSREVLAEWDKQKFDLCYLDPPFYSQRNFGEFDDRWKSYEDYLSFIKEILSKVAEVMSPTGSIYVHLDDHAVHEIKGICDDYFTYQTTIVWKRQSCSKNTSNIYGRNADFILFCTMSDKFVFNPPVNMVGVDVFPQVEEVTGRRFKTHPLLENGEQGGQVFYFLDKKFVIPEGKRLKWSQETLTKRLEKNPRLVYWTKNGQPRYKRYYDSQKRMAICNVWDDISLVSSTSIERTGYPTQKPEALLERIVRISSNYGQWVLDPCMGSGTTAVVCKINGRNFVGIDKSDVSHEITNMRLKKATKKKKVRNVKLKW